MRERKRINIKQARCSVCTWYLKLTGFDCTCCYCSRKDGTPNCCNKLYDALFTEGSIFYRCKTHKWKRKMRRTCGQRWTKWSRWWCGLPHHHLIFLIQGHLILNIWHKKISIQYCMSIYFVFETISNNKLTSNSFLKNAHEKSKITSNI